MVPIWNMPTLELLGAIQLAAIPLWNPTALTQPSIFIQPITTQPIVTQPITNIPYGQAKGSNPPNNPPNNPSTRGLDPNIVVLINAIGGLN